MSREMFERVFVETGLERVNLALHPDCEAPQLRGETRCAAIDRWLAKNHVGEPYAILDDLLSGTGLMGSIHDREERVTFCKEGVGLHRGHLEAIARALKSLPEH